MLTNIWEALIEAVIDSLKVLPILFLVYLLIEYLTHKKQEKFLNFVKKDKNGVLVGATLGCIPQCGFSAVMADMFNHKLISFGTLIAVFVATSDEAIPILLSYPNKFLHILFLILIKFIFALIFGYICYFLFDFLKNRHSKTKAIGANVNSEEYLNSHDCEIEKQHEHTHEHSHEHGKSCDCCSDNIFISALKHALIIFLYIFIANLIINLVFAFVGEDILIKALNVSPILQIVLAPLIGLIPNCVSSVVLIELYLNNALIFPALVAGLCSGSGVGLIILFKNRKNFKQNLLILMLLYLIGVISGLVLKIIL